MKFTLLSGVLALVAILVRSTSSTRWDGTLRWVYFPNHVFRSFTMSNTRPGNSKFREIIPAAQHNRNQVMILYTSSAGASKSNMAIVTVDSPKIIFAVEPIMGLLDFLTSAFPPQAQVTGDDEQQQDPDTASPPPSTLSIRLDLHDVSVSVLESDADADSRAIKLSIKQVFLSQQVRGHVCVSLTDLTSDSGNPCIERRPSRHVFDTYGQRRRDGPVPR